MNIKFAKILVLVTCLFSVTPVMAQFNLKKAAGALANTAKAVTLTDEQMAAFV